MNEEDATRFSGSESDRNRLLELHRQYLDSNLTLDTEALRKIWSGNPDCVFFNGNGYTYHGLAHWTKLWDFYRDQVKTAEPWQSTDVRLTGGGDMALLTCERTCKVDWTGEGEGEGEAPDFTNKVWKTRSTEVYARENGDWRCVHLHISTATEGPRPGGI